MTTTASTTRYNFYMEELRKAEDSCVAFTGFATGIGKCKAYTRVEKGRALETLTAAWSDFTENR